MRIGLKHISIFALAVAAVSCKFAGKLADTTNELFRGQVVAKVGEHRLYLSQLESYIPSGVSPEDSAALASQWINAWAKDLLMVEMAMDQLSPEEQDVSRELEEYRRTLLKYRYEQLYINQRLDTLVTDEEISAYYKENQAKFRLDRPIIKARCLIIPADAKSFKKLKGLMSSDNEIDLMEADSLAAAVAIKYTDLSDSWTDAIPLAQELGTDYRTLVRELPPMKNAFAQLPDEGGNRRIAYILDWVPEGRTAPQDYCTERIRDLILSNRKHSMEETLEQDLLEEARKNNKFVIY